MGTLYYNSFFKKLHLIFRNPAPHSNVYPLFLTLIDETNEEHNTQTQQEMIDPEGTLLKNLTHKHFESPCLSLPKVKC